MKSESRILNAQRRWQERCTAHIELICFENAYWENACYDPWLPEVQRHWVTRRVVDYSKVCWA